MFKTKEELKEEWTDRDSHDDGVNNGIDVTFDSFAERVDFYKKYRDNKLDLLRRDHEDVYWKWYKYYHSHPGHLKLDYMRRTKLYLDWLFDFCFGDIK